jgi:flagellar protein FliO/FliZ
MRILVKSVRKRIVTLIFAFLAFVSSYALAEDDKTVPSTKVASAVTQPSDHFLQITLSLLLILVIIFLAAFLLRRYAHINGAVNGQLKVIGGLALGQREKLVLVQVGKEQILLGVTTSKISKLHVLEEPLEQEDNKKKPPSSFAQRMQEALNKKSFSSQGMADLTSEKEKP